MSVELQCSLTVSCKTGLLLFYSFLIIFLGIYLCWKIDAQGINIFNAVHIIFKVHFSIFIYINYLMFCMQILLRLLLFVFIFIPCLKHMMRLRLPFGHFFDLYGSSFVIENYGIYADIWRYTIWRVDSSRCHKVSWWWQHN